MATNQELIDTDAGNRHEEAAKQRGWGFYASHLGRLSPGGYYMKRWVFRLPSWVTRLTGLGSLRLHLILRSDADRHLHDHPFDFTSLLLTGGYLESVPHPLPTIYRRLHRGETKQDIRKAYYRPMLSVVRKKAEDRHTLELDRPVLTLVLAGPKRRTWGFHTENGFVPWRQYPGNFIEHPDRSTPDQES